MKATESTQDRDSALTSENPATPTAASNPCFSPIHTEEDCTAAGDDLAISRRYISRVYLSVLASDRSHTEPGVCEVPAAAVSEDSKETELAELERVGGLLAELVVEVRNLKTKMAARPSMHRGLAQLSRDYVLLLVKLIIGSPGSHTH